MDRWEEEEEEEAHGRHLQDEAMEVAPLGT